MNDGKLRGPKLKECPFCGSMDVDICLDAKEDEEIKVSIECLLCGARVDSSPFGEVYVHGCTKIETLLFDIECATDNWNRRCYEK